MTTNQSSNQPASRTVIWFFRVLGPVLLASLLAGQFLVPPGNAAHQVIAGLLYLVAWVGSYLAFLEYRETRRAFGVPFVLIAVAIVLLAAATLLPAAMPALPAETEALLRDAARIMHGLAALAVTAIGWTTTTPRRASRR